METFEPVKRCQGFVPGYTEWQEKFREELKK
jgi:hypothetical protein